MSQPRKDSRETRLRIINAAERLFASRGIDNVSLVDIGREAGQRNRNALQYHFGDKEGLIHAVLDKHTHPIAEWRKTRLDALEARGKWTLRELIPLLVEPVAAKLDDPDGGRDFILINSQLMSNQSYSTLRWSRSARMPEVKRLEGMLRACLPTLPAPLLEARNVLVDCMLFHGLAISSVRDVCDRATFVRELEDAIEAVFSRNATA